MANTNIRKMGSVDELLDEMQPGRKIIIYGYKAIGGCLLEFLMNNYYNIRPSNYSADIRCFTTSYDTYEVRQGLGEIKGIPIIPVSELTAYTKTDLVIVAVREGFWQDILDILEKYNFCNIALVSKELYTYLRMENQQISGELRAEVMNYSLCHQNKLRALQEKVAGGKKVKVLFLTQRWAMFGCRSIYRLMEEHDLFESYVLVFSKRDRLSEKWQEEVKEDKAYFEKNGYRVLSAYDEYGYPVDLDRYEPDILFFDCPNLHATAGMSNIRNEVLNWKYLTCYVPYGCLMADSFFYHYENINIRQTWRYFVDTKYSYKRSISGTAFHANNTVLAGYPKLDDYCEKEIEKSIPDKINNGKKIVIYAPHWTIRCNNNYATFHKYYQYFLDLVRENPDINFVFKPHPQLEHRIKLLEGAAADIISYEEYLQYVKEWDSMPNGLYVNEGDYIGLFVASTCLITDCGSFIGEYLPSGHPCIYLLNDEKKDFMDGYTKVAKEILDSYYLCKNLDEIRECVQRVIMDEEDTKKAVRESVLTKEFYHIGNAGKFIVEYLEKYVRG